MSLTPRILASPGQSGWTTQGGWRHCWGPLCSVVSLLQTVKSPQSNQPKGRVLPRPSTHPGTCLRPAYQTDAAEVEETEWLADHGLGLNEVPEHLSGRGLHIAIVL